MRDADVIIVGAGLTGLRVAHELCRAGLSTLIFEKSDSIGGRVRTENFGSYRLDHGFQVVLTAYPELKKLGDLSPLGLRSFSSAARVRTGGRFVDFIDPLRHPEGILRTITTPLASFADLIRLFTLTRGFKGGACIGIDQSTDSGLNERGFSEHFQRDFLRPFLRGVLLDPLLRADFGIARFYLSMFARGDAALPSRGIDALPNFLADKVGRSHIRLNTPVNSVAANEVVLENGDTYSARQVVCAVDSLSAAQLGSPEQTMQHVGTATVYFSAATPPFEEPIIVLNAEDGPIATLAVVSNVQPTYSPSGRSLVAVSVLGESVRVAEETLVGSIRNQLRDWYGDSADTWTYLKTFFIPAAVVTRPRLGQGWREHNGVMYVGDYLSYASQNGAMAAGRTLAENLVERLV